MFGSRLTLPVSIALRAGLARAFSSEIAHDSVKRCQSVGLNAVPSEPDLVVSASHGRRGRTGRRPVRCTSGGVLLRSLAPGPDGRPRRGRLFLSVLLSTRRVFVAALALRGAPLPPIDEGRMPVDAACAVEVIGGFRC